MFPLSVTDPNRTPIPDMRSPLCNCWPRLSKRLPKHTAYCLFLVGPRHRRLIPISKNTIHFRNRARDAWAGSYQNASSLRTRFYGRRRYHESFQRREANNSPNLLWCHEAWHDSSKGSRVDVSFGRNQHLSNQIWDPLRKKETMPDSGNLTNFSLLVK